MPKGTTAGTSELNKGFEESGLKKCGLPGAVVSVVAFKAEGRGFKSTHGCSHTVRKPWISHRLFCHCTFNIYLPLYHYRIEKVGQPVQSTGTTAGFIGQVLSERPLFVAAMASCTTAKHHHFAWHKLSIPLRVRTQKRCCGTRTGSTQRLRVTCSQ